MHDFSIVFNSDAAFSATLKYRWHNKSLLSSFTTIGWQKEWVSKNLWLLKFFEKEEERPPRQAAQGLQMCSEMLVLGFELFAAVNCAYNGKLHLGKLKISLWLIKSVFCESQAPVSPYSDKILLGFYSVWKDWLSKEWVFQSLFDNSSSEQQPPLKWKNLIVLGVLIIALSSNPSSWSIELKESPVLNYKKKPVSIKYDLCLRSTLALKRN